MDQVSASGMEPLKELFVVPNCILHRKGVWSVKDSLNIRNCIKSECY